MYSVNDFQEAKNQSELIEIRSFGLWFTWLNNRSASDVVWEKLDRAFCNESCFSLYPEFRVTFLPIATSKHEFRVTCLLIATFEHAPILMNTFKK